MGLAETFFRFMGSEISFGLETSDLKDLLFVEHMFCRTNILSDTLFEKDDFLILLPFKGLYFWYLHIVLVVDHDVVVVVVGTKFGRIIN